MARRGADAVIEALDRFGVEYVFGHPGGAAMPIFDALLNSKQIKLSGKVKMEMVHLHLIYIICIEQDLI